MRAGGGTRVELPYLDASPVLCATISASIPANTTSVAIMFITETSKLVRAISW
jgi:hypothetical protein